MQYFSILGLDEEKKSKSVRLGVQSLISSLVGIVLLAVLLYFGTVIAINFNHALSGNADFPILLLFGTILFYALASIPLFLGVLEGVTFAVYQCKVNNHKIGLASKIISLICLALAVAGIIAIIIILART